MKNYILTLSVLFASFVFANNENGTVPFKRQDSQHMREILTAWNQNQGDYVYESISSLIMGENQPERPKGVNQTTFEILQSMDDQRLNRMVKIAETELENERENSGNDQSEYYWEEWRNYLESSRCNTNTGAANGDPHMTSFDGKKFDFQNAGDYLLAASYDQTFMVQTQTFRPQENAKISQIGGVSMLVNGDVVEFTSEKDNSNGTKISINGENMLVENTDYILPQGGVINYTGKKGYNYSVKWPTGEVVSIRSRGNKKNRMFDMTVRVPECREYYYDGLLGNNNGDKEDDLRTPSHDDTEGIPRNPSSYDNVFGANRRSPEVMNRNQSAGQYIAYVFSDRFILNEETSLFTNQMVNIPDEVRYPSEYLSLAELSDEQIEEGLKKAREAGVSEEDLYAAVYDYGHVGLEPVSFDDEYETPQRVNTNKEPELDETGDRLQTTNNSSTNSNSNIYISRPVYHYPYRYRNPYPPRIPGGTYTPNTGNSSSGTTIPSRRPTTGSGTSGPRIPGGRR